MLNKFVLAELKAREDGLQSLNFEHRLGRSLNDFFVARQHDGVTNVKADVDDYWTTAFGPLGGVPQGVAIYSRKAFIYPWLMVWTTLTAPIVGATSWVGLENGARGYGGYVALKGAAAANWEFSAHASGDTGGDLDIQALLPAGYSAGKFHYTFKLNKCNAELWMGGPVSLLGRPLRAIVLHGLQEQIPVWEAEPYALGGTVSPIPAQMTTLIELGGTVSSFDIDMTNDNGFVAMDGDPLPPRQFQAYTENTNSKWKALATGGNKKTSHPVPVWGYTRKTLLFEADNTGTLDVEVYIGGAWRVIDTPAVAASTLLQYDLTAEVPIARLVYDPTDGDTIAAAEWFLS